MLTYSQYDNLLDPIMELYESYNQSVMDDIARRIVKTGNMTETAAWQAQRLIESGKVYEDMLDKIAQLTGKSEQELKTLFEQAGVQSMKFDDALYKKVGMDPLPLNLSPAMVNVLKAGLDKTNGVMKNLVMTTAISGRDIFDKASDLAYMQVINGAMSYDQAIRHAIKTSAHEGLSTVSYLSGRTDQIDVAMRRAVLTGVAQTSGKLQETRMEEMGVDLVQVSAHVGARPTHQIWQGKIYSRGGTHKRYPSFVQSTGYGTVSGLCGANCRHSFYPFFGGISKNAYDQKTLNEFDDKRVTYNGQEYKTYDALQVQRKMEREIRATKREVSALDAAGLDNVEELTKIKRIQAQLRDFVQQTGLDRQYVREGGRIHFSGLAERTWSPEERAAIAKRLREGQLRKKGLLQTELVIKPKLKAIPSNDLKSTVPPMKAFEDRIADKPIEFAGLFDEKKKLIFETAGHETHLTFTKKQREQMDRKILVHNHPKGTGFSPEDVQFLYDNNLKSIKVITEEWDYTIERYESTIGNPIYAPKKRIETVFLEMKAQYPNDDVWEMMSNRLSFEYTKTPHVPFSESLDPLTKNLSELEVYHPSPERIKQARDNIIKGYEARNESNAFMRSRGHSIEEYPVIDVKQIEKDFNKNITDIFEDPATQLSTRHNKENAMSILQDRRFKSQFETNTSAAAIKDNQWRSEGEFLGLGIPPELEKELRPIYGYVDNPKLVKTDAAKMFGDVKFVFDKSKIESRTFYCTSDSLGGWSRGSKADVALYGEKLSQHAVGVPITKPGDVAAAATDLFNGDLETHFENIVAGKPIGGGAGMYGGPRYVEIQIQNGATMDDVKLIIMPKNSEFDELAELAKSLGIEVKRGGR